ncbi:metallophosphoesterase family protein [Thermodesulfatator autotrophicus]|uniref:Metallophosphatase n=1 Tax=Thermodesulfatator autotrophicus TaxID=1795632 RepID=A0A177EBG0_9BACT|nr:metallophosphoesterase family protein [Thermodesulfatator autotrophicus]OAG28339.1 metallophosphatase [Thermodesulfatator autotrophicus]
MDNIYAIGDIHGCLYAFEELLAKIPIRLGEDYLVLLGDYIDRGPDPRRVLEMVMELKESYGDKVIALMGNHEWMLLRYLEGDWREAYLANGGDITLAQFTNDEGKFEIPPEYVDFLASLPLYWETERYIFVHAGLKPGRPLDKQRLEDLLFIREEFIYSDYDWGKRVVFAHTPFRQPFLAPNKIGIDTGCVYGGELTALVLPEIDFYFQPCQRRR